MYKQNLTRLAVLAASTLLWTGCESRAFFDDGMADPQQVQLPSKGRYIPPGDGMSPQDEIDEPPLTNAGLEDRGLLLLSPWIGRSAVPGSPLSMPADDEVSLLAVSALQEIPPERAPSGLYVTAGVDDITLTEIADLRAAAAGWNGCGSVRPFRLYQGELQTLPGQSRPIGVLIDADITTTDDASIVDTLFRAWAALPPELRADPLLPTLYELNTKDHFNSYTVGTSCDARLNAFTSSLVVTSYEPWYFRTNPSTGAPPMFGIFWHEAAGHLVADAKPGTCDGPVVGEPYLTLYSHRGVLGWQEREVSAERMMVYVGALWADSVRSDPTSAEPATVERRMLKCGFPLNHAIMENAFDWMASYFDAVSCAGYFHPVPVINGHFAQATHPDDVAIYGDSGRRTTCLVNLTGLDSPSLPSGASAPAVVAQVLPGGVLACSAVCSPNGTVQDIYGFVAGNGRACITIEQCFADSRGWYNAVQDLCEFENAAVRAPTRCREYFGGQGITLEDEPRRCMSPLMCEQRWDPPQSIGYAGEVDGAVCHVEVPPGVDTDTPVDPDSDPWT
ncbi:MAG: hypothetical protein ABIJ09_13225 [Pseudomonadota bacterium]